MVVIIFIILGLIVFGGISSFASSTKKEMALIDEVKDLGAKEGILTKHIEGLGVGVVDCKVIRFEDRILIEANNRKFEIKLEKIRAAVVKSEEELIVQNKSVVGRALIGTLIVPGLGTIIGGMSGVGTKNKKGKNTHYLILNYIDSRGELAAVTLQDPIRRYIDKLCKNINDSIPNANEVISL